MSILNVNFNASFNIFPEQSSCAFSWINKRSANIKINGKTVKRVQIESDYYFFKYCFIP